MHAAFGGQGEGGSELGPLHTVPQTAFPRPRQEDCVPLHPLLNRRLHCCITIGGQRRSELIGMDKLSQALQTFDQAWAWTLNDVYVDVIYLVRFDCVNIGPVGAFVD